MQQDENNAEKAAAEADRWFAGVRNRANELRESGLSQNVAFGMAELESRLHQWPDEWGMELRVLIYGDFDAPDHDLEYPTLGITVKAGKLIDTVIKSALCVVRAHVRVHEKSLSAVSEAIVRLNTMLGIWTIIDWGNRGIGWWCHLTGGAMAGVGGPFETEGIEITLASIQRLPPDVSSKIRAALFWMREPKQMLLEGFKSDILRVYAGYWNAFECLVEAVCQLRPHVKMTKDQKQAGIAQFVASRQGPMDVDSVSECYRLFVDPGFTAKASHALQVTCQSCADGYINECFRAKPVRERLYSVRNSINHGDVDCDSLLELIRIQEKQHRLKMIVFRMLGSLIDFSYPLDPGPR